MKTILITFLSSIVFLLNPVSSLGQTTGQVTDVNTTQAMMPPMMGLTSTYALFSSNGSVSNSGITFMSGDIGTNVGQTTGFDMLNVKGNIHLLPDGATNSCIGNLLTLYNYLNLLPPNVELLNPAQFGHNLILTPQTYHLNAATMLTDTLFINALGNPNALFCIQINGALTTTANSRVIFINGAMSKNVFWKIEGAVTLSDHTIFRGIIVSNNGAIDLKTGVTLDGCALTTNGAISVIASTVIIPTAGTTTAVENIQDQYPNVELTVAPNPFGSYTTINLKNDSKYMHCNFAIYNSVGVEVLNSIVSKQVITLDTSHLNAGIYFYKLSDKNKIIQSGKLISQK